MGCFVSSPVHRECSPVPELVCPVRYESVELAQAERGTLLPVTERMLPTPQPDSLVRMKPQTIEERIRQIVHENRLEYSSQVPFLFLTKPNGTTDNKLSRKDSIKYTPKEWVELRCTAPDVLFVASVPQIILLTESEKREKTDVAYNYRAMLRDQIREEKFDKHVLPHEETTQPGLTIQMMLFNEERRHRYRVSIVFRDQKGHSDEVLERFSKHQVQVHIETLPFEHLQSEERMDVLDVPLDKFISSGWKDCFPLVNIQSSPTDAVFMPCVKNIRMHNTRDGKSLSLVQYAKDRSGDPWIRTSRNCWKARESFKILWKEMFNYINTIVANYTGVADKQLFEIVVEPAVASASA